MTLAEVQELARKAILDGLLEPQKFGQKVCEFLGQTLARYEELEPEAQTYIDDVSAKFLGMVESNLEKTQDSPNKRTLLRQIAFVKGSHFRAEGFTEGLASGRVVDHFSAKEAGPLFHQLLQALLDVLFDATRVSQRGAFEFAAIALLFWAIDELVAAFHLAQHGYGTQALAHVRTVFEILDKVELFEKEPKWAEFWATANAKDLIRELSPAAVREKIGHPRFSPAFSMLSELGTHATFRGVQARVGKRADSAPGNTKVTVWLGGVPRVDQIVNANCLVIMASMSALLAAVRAQGKHLNEEEAIGILKRASEVSANFLEKHLVVWAESEGVDVQPMLKLFAERPRFD